MKRIAIAVLLLIGTEASLRAESLSLFQIGHNFGSSGQWRFGVDKAATVGGCAQRELSDGQWLMGPCRDVFVLARYEEVAFHAGFAVLYNTEGGNASYTARLGVNVGPAAKAGLVKLSEVIPSLDKIWDLHLPPFLNYLGHVTTIDYGVGWRPIHTPDVFHNLTHGPMAKMDIPFDDLKILVKPFGF